jgi:hypothetical protein
MAAAASGTLNIFSEYLISIAASPPISFWTATRAEYMDWLKAMSVVALGMMTATRTGLAAGAGVAGAAWPQAVNNSMTASKTDKTTTKCFFILPPETE